MAVDRDGALTLPHVPHSPAPAHPHTVHLLHIVPPALQLACRPDLPLCHSPTCGPHSRSPTVRCGGRTIGVALRSTLRNAYALLPKRSRSYHRGLLGVAYNKKCMQPLDRGMQLCQSQLCHGSSRVPR